MPKKLNDTTMEKIISFMMVYNWTQVNTAKEVGFSTDTVRRVCKAFRLVRDQKWEEIVQEIWRSEINPDMVKFSARKLCIGYPEDLIDSEYELFRASAGQKYKKQNKEEPAAEEKPETVKTIQAEMQSYNEDLYFAKILQALNNIDKHLVQLMDVVIPKYVSDLKDNANVNTDVLNKSMQACVHYLDGIRCNTRKRGL